MEDAVAERSSVSGVSAELLKSEHPAVRERRLRGLKKAAVLLVFLGEKISSQIFKHLHEEEVKLLSRAISDLGVVPPETTDSILEECYRELISGDFQLRGDLDYVRKVVESAFDPEVAHEVLRFLAGGSMTTSEGLKTIRYADPNLLSKLLQNEHPQSIALVLSYVEPEMASEVLRFLDDEVRTEVAMRLAQLDHISQPVQDKVTEIIATKLRESGQFDQNLRGGVRKVAEIFNRMERNLSRDTLEAIESENPNLAISIRNLMFVFDDILLLSDQDVRKIIQRVDKRTLARALKGTPEEVRDYFFQNMSQRAREMLQEDIEAMGAVRLKDAEGARQEVVAVIREMEGEGQIDLRGSTGGDQFVE